MESLKAGVIGIGYIGPAHVEALKRIGGVEVAAVCDENTVRANEYANKQGIPKMAKRSGRINAVAVVEAVLASHKSKKWVEVKY